MWSTFIVQIEISVLSYIWVPDYQWDLRLDFSLVIQPIRISICFWCTATYIHVVGEILAKMLYLYLTQKNNCFKLSLLWWCYNNLVFYNLYLLFLYLHTWYIIVKPITNFGMSILIVFLILLFTVPNYFLWCL